MASHSDESDFWDVARLVLMFGLIALVVFVTYKISNDENVPPAAPVSTTDSTQNTFGPEPTPILIPPSPTDEQIYNSVDSYFKNNPPPSPSPGPAGEPGKDGKDGKNGPACPDGYLPTNMKVLTPEGNKNVSVCSAP